MSQYTVSREYPYPLDEVWTVVTDPKYVAQWTVTGQGGRLVGFEAIPGNTFQLVGKPTIGWAGIVYCEVIEVEASRYLHYTWKGDKDTDNITDVRYHLEEIAGGTRFTVAHIGFAGVTGFAMSKLLGNVRRKMLAVGIPPVLAAYHHSLQV